MSGKKTNITISEDTLFSKDIVEFVLGISEGPIGGLLNGTKTFYLDDTPLTSMSGRRNFEGFQIGLYYGGNPATRVRNKLGGTVSNVNIGVPLSTGVQVLRTTPAQFRNLIDRIEFRVVINSLYYTDSSGNVKEETIRFRIGYRPAGSVSSFTWLRRAGNPDGPQNVEIRGKTTGGYVREYTIGLPRADHDWELAVELLSDDSDPDRVRSMSWESYQVVQRTFRRYNDLAVVRGIGVASEQFSGVPTFSGVYAGRIIKVPVNYNPVTRFYNGAWNGTFKDAHTDNPAWILYDILTNPRYGFKRYYPELLVDRFSFYDAADWCDELVQIPGGGFQPRYTYNDYIQEARLGFDMVHYIAAIFGGVLVSDLNGSVRLLVDKPGNIVQVFGEESVTEDGFTYQFSDISQRINDITVEFVNPDLGWEKDVRRVSNQEAIDRNGHIPDEFVAVGCINPNEAQRRAHRRFLLANTETTTVTFKTARQAIALDIFDLIGVSDPYMNWGLSGRVKSVEAPLITLRDPLFLPVGVDIDMKVQTPSGVSDLVVRTTTPLASTLNIVSGEWPADAPEFSQFSLSQNTIGLTKPFRIIAIEEDDANAEIIQITALEHNVNKYGDADNLTSSGTVSYDYEQAGYPTAPEIIEVSSGTGQLYVNGSGNVVSRIFVRWVQNSRYLSDRFLVYYRRKDYESFQSLLTGKTEAFIDNVQDGEIYEIYIVAVNVFDRRSTPSETVEHIVIGKTEPPNNVTNLQAEIIGPDIRLSWNPVVDIDLSHYEIMVGQEVLGTTQDARFFDRNVKASEITYLVRAVDTSGNKSLVPASVTVTLPAPGVPSAVLDFIGPNYRITIDQNPADTMPILEYVIRSENQLVFRGRGSVFSAKAEWLGARNFEISVINSAGRESPPIQISGVVIPPGPPSVNIQVIDNNVLIRWTNSVQTLPIETTEFRKGPDFETAEVLQFVDGTFATFFESEGGTYDYWIVSIDTAGNLGEPVLRSVLVDQPPDFFLIANFQADFQVGEKAFAVIDSQGGLIFGVDPTETWEQHFTNNSWTSPQDQINAGFPVYIQPSLPLEDSYYAEEFDILAVVPSATLTVTPTMQVIAGNPDYRVDIAYRADPSDPWIVTPAATKIYATDVRYIRVEVHALDDTPDDLLRMISLNISTGLRLGDDAGNGVASATDVNGTPVSFSRPFIDIVSISVTPLSTTPVIAVYDFLDVQNPTGFSVYLFDRDGNRVSGSFSWTARGY